MGACLFIKEEQREVEEEEDLGRVSKESLKTHEEEEARRDNWGGSPLRGEFKVIEAFTFVVPGGAGASLRPMGPELISIGDSEGLRVLMSGRVEGILNEVDWGIPLPLDAKGMNKAESVLPILPPDLKDWFALDPLSSKGERLELATLSKELIPMEEQVDVKIIRTTPSLSGWERFCTRVKACIVEIDSEIKASRSKAYSKD
ncbi:hypothetical protein ACLOJK_024903 [Asimina triloba]